RMTMWVWYRRQMLKLLRVGSGLAAASLLGTLLLLGVPQLIATFLSSLMALIGLPIPFFQPSQEFFTSMALFWPPGMVAAYTLHYGVFASVIPDSKKSFAFAATAAALTTLLCQESVLNASNHLMLSIASTALRL